jgi:hypothetical protein
MGYYDSLRNQGYGVGMRVKVVHQWVYPTMELIGLVGTIETVYSNQIAVRLDDVYNRRSSRGLFYFKASELKVIEEDIKEENAMSNITNYLNAVKIKFFSDSGSSQYLYANFDPELAVNDVCVVKYPSKGGGMGVATVVEIFDKADVNVEIDREVVAKVDMQPYDYRVATRAKAAELKAKMQERAKKLQDIALYQMLAKDDADMLALLQEYQALPEM